MLHPQNGGRIVAIDFVTSLRPMLQTGWRGLCAGHDRDSCEKWLNRSKCRLREGPTVWLADSRGHKEPCIRWGPDFLSGGDIWRHMATHCPLKPIIRIRCEMRITRSLAIAEGPRVAP